MKTMKEYRGKTVKDRLDHADSQASCPGAVRSFGHKDDLSSNSRSGEPSISCSGGRRASCVGAGRSHSGSNRSHSGAGRSHGLGTGFRRIVSLLCCAALLAGTLYFPVPTAAEDRIVYCGQDEHQHTDDCYEEKLVCKKSEDGHVHDDSCYEVKTKLTCEIPAHVHDEKCYDKDGKLTCALQEHFHYNGCYWADGSLACGLEESEGHFHDASCYKKDGTLSCKLEEGDGHVHEKGCYEMTRKLICGQKEKKGHTHDESCYKKVLTCGLRTHVHNSACYQPEPVEDEILLDEVKEDAKPKGSKTEKDASKTGQESDVIDEVLDGEEAEQVDDAVNAELEDLQDAQAGDEDIQDVQAGNEDIQDVQEGDDSTENGDRQAVKKGSKAGTDTVSIEPEDAAEDGIDTTDPEESIQENAVADEVTADEGVDSAEQKEEMDAVEEARASDRSADSVGQKEKTDSADETEASDGADNTADQKDETDAADEAGTRDGSADAADQKDETDAADEAGTLDGSADTADQKDETDAADEAETRDGSADAAEQKDETGAADEAGTMDGSADAADQKDESDSAGAADEKESAETEAGVIEEEKTKESASEAYERGTLIFRGADYTVTASYGSEACIPSGAVLTAQEITQEDQAYREYCDRAEETVSGSAAWVRLFDISIEKDGVKIEPQGAVTVQITFDDSIAPAAAGDNAGSGRGDSSANSGSSSADEEIVTIHFEGEKESPVMLDTLTDTVVPEADRSAGSTGAAEESTGETGRKKGSPEKGAGSEKRETESGKREAEKAGASEGINQVTFTTDSFSVFAVVQVTREKTITASDGNVYLVSVTFDNNSGIPMDAELAVSELLEGTEAYDSYVQRAAETLGKEVDHLAFAHAFDISLIDPKTGGHCQPTKPVQASIRLLDTELEDDTGINLLHFGDEVETMDCALNDGAVEFMTAGFSVYVLTQDDDHLCTYYFRTYNEYGQYDTYYFETDTGAMTSELKIKNGEKLFAPNNPSHPSNPKALFVGWFEGSEASGNLELGERFNFDQEQNLGKTDPTTVYLYAVFSNSAFVRFHGQYNSVTDSYPVVESYWVDLSNTDPNTEHSINVDLTKFSATYYNSSDNNAFPEYRFFGWSDTPFQNPGEGESYKKSSPYEVTESVDLYPLFEEIRWLSPVSGNSGTGAKYYSPLSCAASSGFPENTFQNLIPTRPGYTFQGWYLSVENEGTDAQNGTGIQLTEADGSFATGFDNEAAAAYHVTVTSDQGNKTLWLSENVNIYARWAVAMDYTVIVWKQMAGSESYEYAESFKLNTTTVTTLAVGEDYKALYNRDNYNNVHDSAHQIPEGEATPYDGFTFNEEKSDTTEKVIVYDGSTVFNLYYDKTEAGGTDSYTITFVYPDGVTPDVVRGSITSGDSLASIVVPDALEKDGYDFHWYADESATARVFFDADSYNDSDDRSRKVLYATMPAQDLKIYGGWTKHWYLIQIDPNYGELAHYDGVTGEYKGNGSTYFWKTYQGDYIQEYTWVTRDYVESESGNYYYVNHDASYGGHPDRWTYYTDDVSKATELKTFKYAPGTYVSAGWYEVKEDGTEEPYVFGVEPITHDTTLKLHWQLAGEFSLEYNAVVTQDGEKLAGTLSGGVSAMLDENRYQDHAVIDLTNTAAPPEGYVFVGWRVRGDKSGKTYYPGEDFILPGEYAVTVSGKLRVYLDAIYDRVPTATIIYHANGGTIADDADGGYPCKLDTSGQLVLDNGEPVPVASYTIARDTTEGTVTVSRIVNNSPVRLSSGAGFTAPAGSDAVLSGWNREPDGSDALHYLPGAWTENGQPGGNPYYADINEPTTLYAEWKVRVYFDSNGANFRDDKWNSYTKVSDPSDPHFGQYYQDVYLNALLAEPAEDAVTMTDHVFDFWSTTPDGAQENAFDFANTAISTGLVLYAHMTDAVMVPFHVMEKTAEGLTEKDIWRRTPNFRLVPASDDANPTVIEMPADPSATTLDNYVELPAGYELDYACVSDSAENVSDTDPAKVVKSVLRYTTTDISYKGQDDAVHPLPDGQSIYLIYKPSTPIAPSVTVVYVKEIAGGTLTKLKGYLDDGHERDEITYDGAPVSLTNVPLQDGTIPVNTTELTLISQDSVKGWHMLPLLDDGTKKLAQVYYKLGVGDAYSGGMNISALGENVSADLNLYLRIQDNKLQWSYDNLAWKDFTASQPTIYAIYRERGYELDIVKTVTKDDTGIDPDKIFTVTLSSMAITRESYTVEGTGYSTIDATPATDAEPGKIELSLKHGTDVKIIGLASGSYTVTETRNEGFNVSIMKDDVKEADGSTYTWELNNDTRIDLLNEPNPICRISNLETGDIEFFYTLNRALAYAGEEMDGTATIEMLMDYVMPSTDALEIPSGYHITLTGRNAARTIQRDINFSSGPMFTNNGTLTLEKVSDNQYSNGITLDGNGENVTARSAMLSNKGTLTLGDGATLQNTNCSVDGGAVSQTGGTLTVQSGATITGNNAANGGAVYAEGGSVTVYGGNINNNSAGNGGAICYTGNGAVSISDGSFTENSAQNGGVIYAAGGAMTISGGIFGGAGVGNRASVNGGVIYMNNAIAELSQPSGKTLQLLENSAQNGGAVYVEEGTLTVSDGSMSANQATTGNGGAVYNKNGTVSVSGGSMTRNSALDGYGGAVYTDTGSFEMSGGTTGGSVSDANSAKNGAGVFINSGAAAFSGGELSYNTAADGGGLGVGGTEASLSFSGNIKVQNNTMNGKASNIYLDQDTDEVINIALAGLGNSAYLGIYVPGAFDSDLFKNRGSVGARFGTYLNTANLNKLHNDRQTSLQVTTDTVSQKLVWGKTIKVEVRYLQKYAEYPNGFPPKATATFKYTKDDYYPIKSNAAVSELGEDLREKYSISLGTSVYGAAFLEGASAYTDYITHLVWEDTEGDNAYVWKAVKKDGTKVPVGDKKIIIYYSEPAYISISNNTAAKFTVSSMTVLDQSVISNYGLVFARNGAIQDALLPVTAGDLELAAGDSISILIPGGQNQNYSLEGSFDSASVSPFPVTLKLNGTNQPDLTANPVNLSGKTRSDSGTYDIVFGGEKYICKITDDHRFATLVGAVQYAKDNSLKAVTIEMLVDYLMPKSDVVAITDSEGFESITFTTAKTGTYQYNGERATISRANGNTASPMITVTSESITAMQVSIQNLDFDGKSLEGACDGGALKTVNCKVTIENADFKNFISQNGGGIFVSFGTESKHPNPKYNAMQYEILDYSDATADLFTLNIKNANFKNCESKPKMQRCGGGAVWTNAKQLKLENCSFEACKATKSDNDQGGAVFHRIESKNPYYYPAPYSSVAETSLDTCTFTNCTASAGGGMESDAPNVYADDCHFISCSTTKKDGGAINMYIYENSMTYNTDPSELHLTGCHFLNCTSVRNGGAVRSLALDTFIEDCTFTNTTTTGNGGSGGGGAVFISNTAATKTIIRGSTFTGTKVTSNGNGGAVYTAAKALTVESSQFTNCTVKGSGGAIYQAAGTAEESTASFDNSTISGCTATVNGGAYYTTNVETVTLSNNCNILNNTASGNGGGICDNKNDAACRLTVEGCSIKGNTAGGQGGGIYTLTQLTLADNTQITGNRLTTSTKDNAAGVYLSNNRTLTVGKTLGDNETLSDGTTSDGTSVINNVTASNGASNMRLWWNSNRNHENSVEVLCHLKGKIYVLNAARKSDKFGIAMGNYLGFRDSGLTEVDHTFIADDDSLFGVFDRTDPDLLYTDPNSDGKINIIWRGDIVCKLTDANGRMLYLDSGGNEPAIFDRLDYGTGGTDGKGAGSPVSPFSYLRQDNPALWVYNEQKDEYESFDVNTSACCVKLMTETYDLSKQILSGDYPNRNITMTTAGRTDSLYPYTGTAGTRATINRGTLTGALFNVKVNLTLRNIVIDGGGYVAKGSGGLIYAEKGKGTFTITLAENTMLQNGGVMVKDNNTGGNGGAIYLNNCTLSIEGGTFYNCTAKNGGAVFKSGGTGTVEFSSGLITKCTATGDGGGVYLDNSVFNMSGGTQITRCTANKGGGVYINASKTMNMSGGSITLNTASTAGGGIATGDSAKLSFSGHVTVNGNKLNGQNCNVQLDYARNTIINSKGLDRGSYIGVYVSGEYNPLTPEQRTQGIKHDPNDTPPYSKHGGEGDPFGSYTSDSFLYLFVNDRNNLKGGLKTGGGSQIYWTTIFSLEVSKLVMSNELSDTDVDFYFSVVLTGTDDATGRPASEINATSEEWEDGSTVSFVNGRIDNLTLKSGQSRVWNNLPSGIKYTVKEKLNTEQKRHYTTFPAEKDSDGNPQKTGTINENLYREDVGSKYLSEASFKNMSAVCKITLSSSDSNNGALLYEFDDESGVRTPAVYARLDTAFGTVNSGTRLYYKNIYTNRWTAYDPSKECNIEMLVPEYTMKAAVTLESGKKVCLTTADPDAKDYPYAGERNTKAVVKRGSFNSYSMFTAKGALAFENVELNGMKSSYTCKASGSIVNVTSTGSLAIRDNAKLCDAKSSSNGGAVFVNGGTMTMTGGKITDNQTTKYGGGAIRMEGNNTKVTISGGEITGNEVQNNDANGGAISVKGGTLAVSGGTISNNSVKWVTGSSPTPESIGGAIFIHRTATATISGGVISGNQTIGDTAVNCGGAVYAEGKLTLSGGTFYGNTAKFYGAGIYLKEGSKLNISGNPTFGDGTEGKPANTIVMDGYSTKKNGGQTVYENNKVRQDIYIAGYASPSDDDISAASLVVNGNITSGKGTIWVWAEQSPRYKALCQLATYTTDVTNTETTLAAFRNARDDAITGADQVGEYLYGITKEDDTGNHVFWYGIEGSAHVMLVKVSKNEKSYTALSGKTFTVYTDSGMTNKAKGTILKSNGEEDVVTLENLSSGAGGAFFIGELSYGKYYVNEEGVIGKHFEFAVSENGVITIEDYNNKTVDPVPQKTLNLISNS